MFASPKGSNCRSSTSANLLRERPPGPAPSSSLRSRRFFAHSRTSCHQSVHWNSATIDNVRRTVFTYEPMDKPGTTGVNFVNPKRLFTSSVLLCRGRPHLKRLDHSFILRWNDLDWSLRLWDSDYVRSDALHLWPAYRSETGSVSASTFLVRRLRCFTALHGRHSDTVQPEPRRPDLSTAAERLWHVIRGISAEDPRVEKADSITQCTLR